MDTLTRLPFGTLLSSLVFTSLLLMMLPSRALALDESPRDVLVAQITALEDAAQDARRNKDADALVRVLAQAVPLHREASNHEDGAPLSSRVVKLAGKLTKDRHDTVRVAALEALGSMGDERGGRYVKPFLKPLKDGRGAPVALAAIDAAGAIHADPLVAPLLRIVEKAKLYSEAAQAMRALAHFGESRHRARILETLAKTLRKDLPGGPKRGQESRATNAYIRGKPGNAGTDRWRDLAPILPTVLNDLTGLALVTATDWMEMVREHKRDLGALFVEDPAHTR